MCRVPRVRGKPLVATIRKHTGFRIIGSAWSAESDRLLIFDLRQWSSTRTDCRVQRQTLRCLSLGQKLRTP